MVLIEQTENWQTERGMLEESMQKVLSVTRAGQILQLNGLKTTHLIGHSHCACCFFAISDGAFAAVLVSPPLGRIGCQPREIPYDGDGRKVRDEGSLRSRVFLVELFAAATCTCHRAGESLGEKTVNGPAPVNASMRCRPPLMLRQE